jgi:hypothetical protein
MTRTQETPMNRMTLPTAGLALALASGCVVYADDQNHGGPVVVGNSAPYVTGADAYVYYDPYYFDDIWTFEAWVDDPDGVYDVIAVWADVYDGPVLVESFELYPTNDPYYWWSDWLGSTTRLDPFWGGYSVDIVAYDSYEAFGYETIRADTY